MVLCVVCWFATSAVCTSAGKVALTLAAHKTGGCALSLTLAQFVIAAAVSCLCCVLLRRTIPSAPRELLCVSVAYTLGFLLLNQSLGRLHASFSETVRSLEPLTSFVLAYLLSARGTTLGRRTAGSLLAVLLGAVVSVWAQPGFDVRGFVYGLLANCAFSSRGVFVTKLQDATRRQQEARGVAAEKARGVDSVALFAAQHAIGLVLLLPAAMLSEGTKCSAVLVHSKAAARASTLRSAGARGVNRASSRPPHPSHQPSRPPRHGTRPLHASPTYCLKRPPLRCIPPPASSLPRLSSSPPHPSRSPTTAP